MLFRTIRFKIILLYMVLLTLTITVFTIVLYNKLQNDLYRNADNLLQSRAEGIEDSIDTYWEVEKLQVKKAGGKTAASKKIDIVNFSKIARLWVDEESNAPELLNIIVQIFDAKGTIIVSSKNIPGSITFPRDFYISALQGKQRFDTTTFSFSDAVELKVRVLTKPVFQDDTIMYIVQVASPWTPYRGRLMTLRRYFLYCCPWPS
jgi:hypothetical protein